jgi:hypothetical protein
MFELGGERIDLLSQEREQIGLDVAPARFHCGDRILLGHDGALETNQSQYSIADSRIQHICTRQILFIFYHITGHAFAINLKEPPVNHSFPNGMLYPAHASTIPFAVRQGILELPPICRLTLMQRLLEIANSAARTIDKADRITALSSELSRTVCTPMSAS